MGAYRTGACACIGQTHETRNNTKRAAPVPRAPKSKYRAYEGRKRKKRWGLGRPKKQSLFQHSILQYYSKDN